MSALHEQQVATRKLPHSEVGDYRPRLESLMRAALCTFPSAQGIDTEREIAATLNLAERSTNYVTVIAENAERLLAFIVGSIAPDTDSAFILWIVVSPDARRQGIGKGLVDRFTHATRVNMLKGYVNLDDPVAVAFWERRGWRPLNHRPRRVLMGVRI